MITYDNLIITGLDSVVSINGLSFNVKPNQHARLTIDLIIKTELLYNKLYNQNISLSYIEKGQEYTIFCGLVDHYVQKREGNLYTAKLSLVSASIKLDDIKYLRTFQNTKQTYTA